MKITVTKQSTGRRTASTLAEFCAQHIGNLRSSNAAKSSIRAALEKGEPHNVHLTDDVYTLTNAEQPARAKAMRTVFNSREKATTLAALRLWFLRSPYAHKNEHEIPAEVREFFDNDAPLSPAEIDALCERINLEL